MLHFNKLNLNEINSDSKPDDSKQYWSSNEGSFTQQLTDTWPPSSCKNFATSARASSTHFLEINDLSKKVGGHDHNFPRRPLRLPYLQNED